MGWSRRVGRSTTTLFLSDGGRNLCSPFNLLSGGGGGEDSSLLVGGDGSVVSHCGLHWHCGKGSLFIAEWCWKSWFSISPPPLLTPSQWGGGMGTSLLLGGGRSPFAPCGLHEYHEGWGVCYWPVGVKLLAPYLAFSCTSPLGIRAPH